MAGKWSASKVGCFSGCPLRYKFQYVDKFTRYPDSRNEYSDKGHAVHETVEKYHPGMSEEDLYKLLDENTKKYNVDTEKYPVRHGIEKFLIFWNRFVQPKLDAGYTFAQETWANGTIAREPFCGALDLYLENKNDPTAPVYIIDWKTGQSMNPNSYKNQQVLYAYLKGKEKNWPNDVIVERTHLIIFYPLGKEYNKLDPDAFLRLPIEEQAMRCAKEIVFTEADLKAVIDDYFIQNILMINQIDFSKFDGSEGHLGHDCSYCPFAGAKPNPEIGFMGCPKSLEAEVEFPEGFEVVTSEEYKKRKEAEKNEQEK